MNETGPRAKRHAVGSPLERGVRPRFLRAKPLRITTTRRRLAQAENSHWTVAENREPTASKSELLPRADSDCVLIPSPPVRPIAGANPRQSRHQVAPIPKLDHQSPATAASGAQAFGLGVQITTA
jgi:hypothetical protein